MAGPSESQAVSSAPAVPVPAPRRVAWEDPDLRRELLQAMKDFERGQLQDEFDKEGPQVSIREDGTVVVDPSLSTHEIMLPGFETGPYDAGTIGGSIVAALGRLPHPGDSVRMGSYDPVVDEIRHRRISRVSLWPRALTTPPPVASNETR